MKGTALRSSLDLGVCPARLPGSSATLHLLRCSPRPGFGPRRAAHCRTLQPRLSNDRGTPVRARRVAIGPWAPEARPRRTSATKGNTSGRRRTCQTQGLEATGPGGGRWMARSRVGRQDSDRCLPGRPYGVTWHRPGRSGVVGAQLSSVAVAAPRPLTPAHVIRGDRGRMPSGKRPRTDHVTLGRVLSWRSVTDARQMPTRIGGWAPYGSRPRTCVQVRPAATPGHDGERRGTSAVR